MSGHLMRVSIRYQDRVKGLLFPRTYYAVLLSVAFTHEEMQILRQRRLTTTKLLDRRPATAKVDDRDEKFELRLSDLLDGRVDCFLCATPAAAKIYAEDIMGVLQQVKLWITDNAETGLSTVVEF
jgi:hypothetical protein